MATKQRRSRRRNGSVPFKMLCRPAVIPFAGLRYWLDRPDATFRGVPAVPPGPIAEAVLNDAFDKLARAEENAWSALLRGAYGTEEITCVEAMRRGLSTSALYDAGWARCPDKDAWWRLVPPGDGA